MTKTITKTKKVKTTKTTKPVKTEDKTKSPSKKKYIEAVGRRKEAVARVRLMKDKPGIVINEHTLEEYFPLLSAQKTVLSPLQLTDLEKEFYLTIKVKGGGTTGQVEAIRLGISRCLIKYQAKLRPQLKKVGFLTRDARVVERKKYGRKKARKKAQWSKR